MHSLTLNTEEAGNELQLGATPQRLSFCGGFTFPLRRADGQTSDARSFPTNKSARLLACLLACSRAVPFFSFFFTRMCDGNGAL